MWQSIFGAEQLNGCSASFVQSQPTEICMTLFRPNGTAGSFLLLVIIIAFILGVPLILIALRVIEIISEKRYEAERRIDMESRAEMHSADDKESAKDGGEWTPANHMR